MHMQQTIQVAFHNLLELFAKFATGTMVGSSTVMTATLGNISMVLGTFNVGIAVMLQCLAVGNGLGGRTTVHMHQTVQVAFHNLLNISVNSQAALRPTIYTMHASLIDITCLLNSLLLETVDTFPAHY